jgi:hypothetical protein
MKPFLASGQGIIPMIVAIGCIIGLLAAGLALVWIARTTLKWILGAVFCLCGLIAVILFFVFFEKLIRLY